MLKINVLFIASECYSDIDGTSIEQQDHLPTTPQSTLNIMSAYPLYDVPYLVRDPNDFRMSKKRHELEVRNQAVVDDYFLARDKGLSAFEARRQVAERHGITPKRVIKILKWFYEEAKKRKKYDFLIKFSLSEEH